MLTGKRFKLTSGTLAVVDIDGRRRTLAVPGGEILKVVADAETGDGMVDVLWNGHVVEMFAIDVENRGAEIIDPQPYNQSARA